MSPVLDTAFIPPRDREEVLRHAVLVYLKVDPKDVGLVPGFTRDVSGLGHHGTGDLEVQFRAPRDMERARELFRASYAAA